MSEKLLSTKANFGTLPVFLTAISTILGAVMFLRFGFAVGSVGFTGALLIIVIGHMVTIPTAMALAEIATNQKVEGPEGVLKKGKSIREIYHPITGEGRESENFSWSAAHITMLLTED